MIIDLHVQRYGPSGPARVLTIHGVTEHGRIWHRLAHHLPEIPIAAPDLLGHGRSPWAAPWTIDANVSALAALLDNQGDGPVVVVGHSFGGAVACTGSGAQTRSRRWCCSTRRSLWTGPGYARWSTPCWPLPTTWTPPRPGPRRRPVPGRTWTPQCSTPNSTSTSSHCPTVGTVGVSACRRWCATGANWPATSCCRRWERQPRWFGRSVRHRRTSATSCSRPWTNG
ncbi:lipase [Mycobacterium tuberculosis CAS/NITR204]|uniref:Lipase n=1 Tax=Mycobacterium tuberculosis CAS/NITR204 TaxID=1310114 RepID=R4ML07_MYCTX|nr:lipase [Mycobacterium tuberculosis CAS/NITR204]